MKTHITVIPDDDMIIVDGAPLVFEFPAPINLHALQWHEGGGHLEFKDGTPNKPLSEADYAAEVAPFADLWQAEHDRLETENNRPPTLPELQAKFTAAIQEYMDAFFRERNYDGVMSAATYAASQNPKFAAEGQYAVQVRDLVWAKGYEIMDAVLSGERGIPTVEDVLAELPPLAWPDEVA